MEPKGQSDSPQPSTAPPLPQGCIGVGIVGAGERGIYYLGRQLVALSAQLNLRIVGVTDLLPERTSYAVADLNRWYEEQSIPWHVSEFADTETLVAQASIQLVLVTTHTHAHRRPVELALAAGKQVYLDKPIAVTLTDAFAIHEAEVKAKRPIMMGFTRRYEPSWLRLHQELKSGRIGPLQMMLLRSVIPYSRYLQLWHRHQQRSGGAINDKCSHHFDVLNWFADSQPTYLSAMGGRSQVFAPDPNAPERCSQCDRTCPYRRHHTLVDQNEGCGEVANPSWLDADQEKNRNDNCVFLPDADIDDHLIANVAYPNGVKASLFFSIFGPYAKDQETLELVGTQGRMVLTRSTGAIQVVDHYGAHQETIEVVDSKESNGVTDLPEHYSHFGADKLLVQHLENFLKGQPPIVGVNEGIHSLAMVQAALQSMAQQSQTIFLASLLRGDNE